MSDQPGRMATLTVTAMDPRHPDVQPLLDALSNELHLMYADRGVDGRGAVNLSDLVVAGAAFLVARRGERLIGCGALRPIELGSAATAEIKRMFVTPAERGRGVARAILSALEQRAVEFGYRRLVLETGDRQPEAVGLYEHAGYRRCACYGQYAERDWSVCFEKSLDRAAVAEDNQ